MTGAASGTGSHWFEPVADHLGSAYLRYSFTKGTDQEVGFLVDRLGLAPGSRVLDVGCGPGRHALALAELGVEVVGVDISETFVGLAATGAAERSVDHLATFVRGDARALTDLGLSSGFDAAYSLCQGGFGLLGGPAAGDHGPDDAAVLAGMAALLAPGGRLAVSAFSAYLRVSDLLDTTFDAETGTSHEVTEVRDADGTPRTVDLWTTCFTPRELRLLAASVGLAVDDVVSGDPGAYGDTRPNIESSEFVLLAHRW